MQWISYPIPARPGDLPNLTDEQLLAQGYITGFRATRVEDAVATEHLADAKLRCHASTQGEIDAETARGTAAAEATAAFIAEKRAEVQARADLEKAAPF